MSGFTKVCTLDDVWEGEMEAFSVNGHEVLLVCGEGGEIEGKYDGKSLICRAHLWQFDVRDGKGINPDDCALATYPVRIEGEDVLIATQGVEPLFAHS